jgi:DNA-directed RNA polymerase specialized sigma24 family protein
MTERADDPADDGRMPGAVSGDRPPVPDAAEFEALRPLLFTVAYEMLEVAADAEDVVQEAWLRWSRVDPTTVHDPRAYLVRIVIRLSLNRFRTLSRQRETYVGPWLPEPLVTVADVADDVELADSVSTAMLLVLQTLTPVERAVFVLREVFGSVSARSRRRWGDRRRRAGSSRCGRGVTWTRADPDSRPTEGSATNSLSDSSTHSRKGTSMGFGSFSLLMFR